MTGKMINVMGIVAYHHRHAAFIQFFKHPAVRMLFAAFGPAAGVEFIRMTEAAQGFDRRPFVFVRAERRKIGKNLVNVQMGDKVEITAFRRQTNVAQ